MAHIMSGSKKSGGMTWEEGRWIEPIHSVPFDGNELVHLQICQNCKSPQLGILWSLTQTKFRLGQAFSSPTESRWSAILIPQRHFTEKGGLAHLQA
jgi:hypothetical protein